MTTSKTPRGPAANRAKHRYRAKNYDCIQLQLKKGWRESMDELIELTESENRTSFIVDAISEKLKKETGQNWPKEDEK